LNTSSKQDFPRVRIIVAKKIRKCELLAFRIGAFAVGEVLQYDVLLLGVVFVNGMGHIPACERNGWSGPLREQLGVRLEGVAGVVESTVSNGSSGNWQHTSFRDFGTGQVGGHWGFMFKNADLKLALHPNSNF
jgi:hypothetical protein